jgi:nucleotide-binding universal stress UspA family protein
MSQLSMQSVSRPRARHASESGPVVLAAAPVGAMDAPIAVARWLAALEERDLRVVTALEGEGTRGEVPDGSSVEAILDVARACSARVIVVGTGPHDVFGRRPRDDRAMRMIDITDRPVLVVPREAQVGSVDVAVVAVDFSPASVRAARAVMPLLSFGGRLILVHVRTAVSLKEETAEWWDDLYARRCAELFVQFRRQLPPTAHLEVETRFLRGEAAGTVAAFASASGAGLVACGRRTRPVRQRMFAGGVSARLVRHATCPVLVMPALPGDAAVQ